MIYDFCDFSYGLKLNLMYFFAQSFLRECILQLKWQKPKAPLLLVFLLMVLLKYRRKMENLWGKPQTMALGQNKLLIIQCRFPKAHKILIEKYMTFQWLCH